MSIELLSQRVEILEKQLQVLMDEKSADEKSKKEKKDDEKPKKKYVSQKKVEFNTDTWYARNKATYYKDDITICECGCVIKNFGSTTNIRKHLTRAKHLKMLEKKRTCELVMESNEENPRKYYIVD
tara:strand:+ start:253 stop:630 length:378 start_codon:yes stop_codon:yes gene_type:complete